MSWWKHINMPTHLLDWESTPRNKKKRHYFLCNFTICERWQTDNPGDSLRAYLFALRRSRNTTALSKKKIYFKCYLKKSLILWENTSDDCFSGWDRWQLALKTSKHLRVVESNPFHTDRGITKILEETFWYNSVLSTELLEQPSSHASLFKEENNFSVSCQNTSEFLHLLQSV